MTPTERICRFQVVLGALGIVIGVWAFVLARNAEFTARAAPRIGWTYLELNLMSFNRLAAILVFIFASIGLIGGLFRRPQLGWIPTVAFALLALQVIVQWRPSGTNWFGTNGPALAFSLLLSAGFAVTAAVVGPATEFEASQSEKPSGNEG